MKLEKLVSEAQRGDDDAFYQLIYLHKEKLYKVAYAFLRNEADALEAIQEATCRAYLKLSQLRQPEYIATWLTRIVIHVCMDEQKRKKRWYLIPSDLDNRVSGEPLLIDQSATRLHLEDALSRLTPLHRHVIILKYFEDLTIPEIAEVLGDQNLAAQGIGGASPRSGRGVVNTWERISGSQGLSRNCGMKMNGWRTSRCQLTLIHIYAAECSWQNNGRQEIVAGLGHDGEQQPPSVY